MEQSNFIVRRVSPGCAFALFGTGRVSRGSLPQTITLPAWPRFDIFRPRNLIQHTQWGFWLLVLFPPPPPEKFLGAMPIAFDEIDLEIQSRTTESLKSSKQHLLVVGQVPVRKAFLWPNWPTCGGLQPSEIVTDRLGPTSWLRTGWEEFSNRFGSCSQPISVGLLMCGKLLNAVCGFVEILSFRRVNNSSQD